MFDNNQIGSIRREIERLSKQMDAIKDQKMATFIASLKKNQELREMLLEWDEQDIIAAAVTLQTKIKRKPKAAVAKETLKNSVVDAGVDEIL